MRPYLTEEFGNASSVHKLGRQARVALERARERVASVLSCQPAEVMFTSGGTESNNTALRGALAANVAQQTGREGLVTSAAEHEAVLRPAEWLADQGHSVIVITPSPSGAVSPEALGRSDR